MSKKLILLATVGLIALPVYGMLMDPLIKEPGFRISLKINKKIGDELFVQQAHALWLRDHFTQGEPFFDLFLRAIKELSGEESVDDLLDFIITRSDELEKLFNKMPDHDEQSHAAFIQKILMIYRMRHMGPIFIKSASGKVAKK